VIAFTHHFADLAAGYDVILSDVWGVMHNGETASPDASEALSRFREAGGVVVFITNAPRPGQTVIRQLDYFGVSRDAYDGIVSSGDVTRGVILKRPGQSIFHLGPKRNEAIFTGLDLKFAPLETADYVICSGLFDDTVETPDNYRDMLTRIRSRNLFMVCGNPDVIVEVGDKLVYCAGAIADLYGEMGGEVLYAGKPHPPIYEQALGLAERARGKPAARARVHAIGDSVRTDLPGAVNFGIDCLFVTAGIHAEELGARDDPDPHAVARMFAGSGLEPRAVTRKLAW
jgi:HAD superfamily hydrolase (TIGR01459 family)